MRIEALAAERGVAVAWRPFIVGPLFHEQQGLTDSPFNVVPTKGKYMWRDLERVCDQQGLPLRHPSQFPRNSLLAAAQSDPIKARLKEHVAMAKARGLFGAPSFLTADGELFWGNDRLEQALDWAARHQSREHA